MGSRAATVRDASMIVWVKNWGALVSRPGVGDHCAHGTAPRHIFDGEGDNDMASTQDPTTFGAAAFLPPANRSSYIDTGQD